MLPIFFLAISFKNEVPSAQMGGDYGDSYDH